MRRGGRLLESEDSAELGCAFAGCGECIPLRVGARVGQLSVSEVCLPLAIVRRGWTSVGEVGYVCLVVRLLLVDVGLPRVRGVVVLPVRGLTGSVKGPRFALRLRRVGLCVLISGGLP